MDINWDAIHREHDNMIDEIKRLLDENGQLKADLKGKDNEIQVLKWRIDYYKQLIPDIPEATGRLLD